MKRALLVDDAPVILKLVALALEDLDFEVETAASADEALEVLSRSEFDLGVFDVNMPGRDGIQLTRELKALPAGRRMKVVMLTTESATGMMEAAKQAGAAGWLTKPFEPDDLEELLAELFPE